MRFCYFRFDSPARVCFLSLSPCLGFEVPKTRAAGAPAEAQGKTGTGISELSLPLCGMSNARSFQVEQQMVAGSDSTGRPLGNGGLDHPRTEGSRSGRA